MTSLGALGALFFEGGLVNKVVTAYSGNSFPTYNPNPIFRRAYESGAVEVEHWSILTLAQRMEAAARGLPAAVTGSWSVPPWRTTRGSAEIDSPFGPLGLLSPLAPDVALVHAAAADRGATSPSPSRCSRASGVPGRPAGAWWPRSSGGRRPARTRAPGPCPGHRVLAVVEAPFGAHPGGCYAPGLPVRSYGEDIAFWNAAADAAAKGTFDLRRRVGARPVHPRRLPGAARAGASQWLEGPLRPDVVEGRRRRHPVPDDPVILRWEQAAALGAREVERVVADVGADAVLAGAGVANLAAWVAVGRARAGGSRVMLTAELGLWGYEPTPADPYIFNHRVFPGTPYLSDASAVLGMVIGGPGTRTVGCLGAAEVDRAGSLNSTELAGGDSWSVRAGRMTWPAGPRPASSSPWPGRSGCPRPWPTSPRRETGSSAWSPTRVSCAARTVSLRVAAVPAGEGTVEDRVRHLRRVVRVRARGGPPGRGACCRAVRRGPACVSSTANGCS
jgi:hypothetical protein